MNDSNSTATTMDRITPIVIHLLRGILYRDLHPQLWQGLLQHQAEVDQYVSVINLDCRIDESEGYAYLRQRNGGEDDGDETGEIRRLVQRRSLSYPASLLCVLLRKKLVESDASGDESRVILTKEQLLAMITVFLPAGNNEAKIVDQMDATINRLVEYGFLRKLKGDRESFEVRRIIKAFVDADWISDFDEKLKRYQEYANG